MVYEMTNHACLELTETFQTVFNKSGLRSDMSILQGVRILGNQTQTENIVCVYCYGIFNRLYNRYRETCLSVNSIRIAAEISRIDVLIRRVTY